MDRIGQILQISDPQQKDEAIRQFYYETGLPLSNSEVYQAFITNQSVDTIRTLVQQECYRVTLNIVRQILNMNDSYRVDQGVSDLIRYLGVDMLPDDDPIWVAFRRHDPEGTIMNLLNERVWYHIPSQWVPPPPRKISEPKPRLDSGPKLDFSRMTDAEIIAWARQQSIPAPAPDPQQQFIMEHPELKGTLIFRDSFQHLTPPQQEDLCQKLVSQLKQLNMDGNRYMFEMMINGYRVSISLTKDNFNKLIDRLEHNQNIWDLIKDNQTLLGWSDPADVPIPQIRYISSFELYQLDRPEHMNNRNEGAFFPYYHHTYLDLSKYQMYSEQPNKPIEENCFFWALKQSGEYSDSLINQIKLFVKVNSISLRTIGEIAFTFKLNIHVHLTDCKTKSHNNWFRYEYSPGGPVVSLNLSDNHYYLREKLEVTTSYVKWCLENGQPISPDHPLSQKRPNGQKWKSTKDLRDYISIHSLIKLLKQYGQLTPIPYMDLCKTVHYDIAGDYDLEYDPKMCTELIKPKDKKNDEPEEPPQIFYADFEASTDGAVHTPFMCCVSSEDGSESQTFSGPMCGEQLLQYLPNKSITFFHNLGYDVTFLAKFGITDAIQKNTLNYKTDIKYRNKQLVFRDTLPLLNCKLSALPRMFNLDAGAKEIFPYNYYSKSKLNCPDPIGYYDEITELSQDDLTQMKNNCIKLGIGDDKSFNMYKYSEFYCKQDVNILRQAFNKFRDQCKNELDLDPLESLTAPALANKWFEKNVYYNHNLFKVGGHVRDFLSKAIYGGRCMTRDNLKWHVKLDIDDYDAVSLYPSAMRRLYTVKGIPSVLKFNQGFVHSSIMPELKALDAYVVEIEIVKVNKHRHFPLIVIHDEEGNNLNTDGDLVIGKRIVVCDIQLEDLVEFQGLEFKLIRGYCWNSGKDYTIQTKIQELFDNRLKYKKQGNPLQEVYKLIMNSCYGKTIQKPIVYNRVFKRAGADYNKFIWHNFDSLIEDVVLNGSQVHAIKTRKPIDKFKNFTLLGVHILAMSKRIMNEVMCLAEDLGLHIYYQDTDSMHIVRSELPILENAFKEKYGRELRGTNLGQFHPDFDKISGSNMQPYANESYFIGKKLYLDHLVTDDGKSSYHVRGKGLTQLSIKKQAEDHGGYLNLYEKLYVGLPVTFNLADGAPSFQHNNDFTISSRQVFNRVVQAKYDFGLEPENILGSSL